MMTSVTDNGTYIQNETHTHCSVRIEKTAKVSDILEIRFADVNTWFEVLKKSLTQIHISSEGF